MDKYILVSQDKYDELTKRRKNQDYSKEENNQSTISKDSIDFPPPGLPADDELAKSGIELSEKDRVAQLNEKLSGVAYDSNNKIDRVNDSNLDSWKQFWKSAAD